jgi:hypothetical protein
MRVGGREVVGSGSLITHEGDSNAELQHGSLSFQLTFATQPGGQPLVEGTAVGKSLKLTLMNFDNPLGTGWSSEVGTVGGKKLFLALYVSTIGDPEKRQRSIMYTFTKGGD